MRDLFLHNGPDADIAKRYDISAPLLSVWKKKALEDLDCFLESVFERDIEPRKQAEMAEQIIESAKRLKRLQDKPKNDQ